MAGQVEGEGQAACRKTGPLGVGKASMHYNLAQIFREATMMKLSTSM